MYQVMENKLWYTEKQKYSTEKLVPPPLSLSLSLSLSLFILGASGNGEQISLFF